MKNIFILSLTFIAFLSCNKEKSSNHCMDKSLIRQVKTGDRTQQQFTYNENCLVYESIETFIYTKYTYDQSNRLYKEEQAMSLNPASCYMLQGVSGESVTDPRKAKISSYSVLAYDSSGRLKTKSNYFVTNTNQLLSVNSYEYMGNRIVKIKIANPKDELTQFNSFTYDANGNLTRDDYYLTTSGGDSTLNSSTVYEFDDKINPFSIFANSGEPGIKTNTNNILKQTTTDYNSGNEYQYITEYRIEYNPAGYPVKVNDRIYLYGN